jgi:hypothetical protein
MHPLNFSLLVAFAFAGKCTPEDKSIWIGDVTFTQTMEKVGLKCAGSRRAAAKQLKKQYPKMTDDCVGCHADLLVCGMEKCVLECFGKKYSSRCKQCIDNHCMPNYKECLGYSDPKDLPVAPALDAIMAQSDVKS